MHEIRLFGGLRRLACGQSVTAKGTTVRAMLAALREANPALAEAILDGEELRPYVRVSVNGHDVALGQGLDTPLGEDAKVAIFPPITGG